MNTPSPLPSETETEYAIQSLLVIAVSAWPFLSFIGGNSQEFVDLGVVAYAYAGSVGVLALFSISARWLAPSPVTFRRLVNSGCVFFALAFTFGAIGNLLKTEFDVERARYILLVWGLIASAGFAVTWRLSKTRNSTIVLAAATTAMCLAALVEAGSSMSARRPPSGISDPATVPAVAEGRLPNVYYFIFDAYGRADTIRKYLGHDTRDFLAALDKRGFRVLKQSRANYPVSFLSISATLNRGPLVAPGKSALDGYVRYQTLLAGYNDTVRMFRSFGYSYVQAQSGVWDGSRCQGTEDVCIRAATGGFNETGLGLMAMMPLEIVVRKFWPQLIVFNRSLFPDVVRKIRDLRAQRPGPLFVFSHITIPHDLIYDKDCGPRASEGYFDEKIPADMRLAYVDAVNCLNQQILDNVDSLLDGDPDALVIFQGDHGFLLTPMLSQPLKQWDADSIEMRFAILNTMRVPARCRQYLYPAMTAFNTFRFVEGCLKGRAPDYVADRSFRARAGEKEVLPLQPEPGPYNKPGTGAPGALEMQLKPSRDTRP